MLDAIGRKDPKALSSVMNQAGVLISVLDLDGRLIHYSDNIPPMVTRNPSLIGADVRQCHKQEASNQKIDRILDAYRRGEGDSHHWVLERDGISHAVKVTPLRENGRIVGLVHTIMMLA